MSMSKHTSMGTTSGTQKAFLALGAFAVAGMAAVHLGRAVLHWRDEHLKFDFPIEEQLFIGWGGSNPRRVRHSG